MSQPSALDDWDHLRVFLAVAQSSSLRAAGKRLGVTHPTIRRRLQALETQLGVRLFDRRHDGLHMTPEASDVLEMAQDIEASVHALGRRAVDANPKLRGQVRVTAPDVLMTDLLMPKLADFAARWPQIEVHVDSSYEIADLGRREADVAIRAMPRGTSPDGALAGRKAATIYAAVYGSDHQWIGWWGDERDDTIAQEHGYGDLPITEAMSNINLQRAACLAGLGLAILPCFMAEPQLLRRTKPKPSTDIWILVHQDMRRNPRLRVFRDEIAKALKTLRPQLEGTHATTQKTA